MATSPQFHMFNLPCVQGGEGRGILPMLHCLPELLSPHQMSHLLFYSFSQVIGFLLVGNASVQYTRDYPSNIGLGACSKLQNF